MNTVTIISNSMKETIAIGAEIGNRLDKGAVLALSGDLGAGKTVLVQGLAKGLDISSDYYITSPTYTIINEYTGRFKLYHIDLYRVGGFDDLEDIGIFDILHSDHITAIEWPELLEPELPDNHIKINIAILGEEKRRVTINAMEALYHPIISILNRKLKEQ